MKAAPRSFRAALAASVAALVLGLAVAPGALAQGTPPARPAQPGRQAQPAPAQPAPPAAAPAQPQQEANARVTGWQTRCVSQARRANADCVVEQALTLIRTNQVAAIVNLRIPAEGQQPVLNMRVPHGVLLSAGVRMRVDAGYNLDLPVQACEAQGCVVTAPAPAELVNAMRGGKQLNLVMKSGNGQDMGFGMPLDGFAAALDRVK
jgi:invasion protein IalB